MPCINVNLYGGHDAQKLELNSMQTVSRNDITATLAGVLWYLTDMAGEIHHCHEGAQLVCCCIVSLES